MKKYLDEAKDLNQNIKSDTDIANKLKCTPQSIYGARRKGRTLNDEHTFRLAKLCKRHPAELLAIAHRIREKNPAIKKVWKEIAAAFEDQN